MSSVFLHLNTVIFRKAAKPQPFRQIDTIIEPRSYDPGSITTVTANTFLTITGFAFARCGPEGISTHDLPYGCEPYDFPYGVPGLSQNEPDRLWEIRRSDEFAVGNTALTQKMSMYAEGQYHRQHIRGEL